MGRRKRRKSNDEGGATLGWIVTWSDLVTLLLTFFVLMTSMANFEDSAKIQAAVESIRAGFDVRLLSGRACGRARARSGRELVGHRLGRALRDLP